MNMINIGICDKNTFEAHALMKLVLQVIPDADVQIFESSEALLQTIERGPNPYRALFLKVDQGMNGIETARIIRQRDRFVPLIILSNSEKYYKEAFGVFAWQYLLTPVTLKEMKRALEPLVQLWGCILDEKVLYYRYRSQVYTLPHNSILYISSNLHTINFQLKDGSCAHCRGKLDNFEDQLQNSNFLRCHQSFFVNMEAVTSMRKDCFMVGNEMVPISRPYKREAQERYFQFLRGEEEEKKALC